MPRSQNKVYAKYNAPDTKPNEVGSEVYEWDYLDENGRIQKDKKNVKEEIQSFISRVDYKQQIKNGELPEGINNVGNLKDFTGIPSNPVDLINLVDTIRNMDQNEIANLLQQTITPTQETTETGQVLNQITQETGENTSGTGTTDQTTNTGDDK